MASFEASPSVVDLLEAFPFEKGPAMAFPLVASLVVVYP